MRAKPGATVSVGQTVALLESSVPRKKLEALREELAEFQAAADQGNANAKRDLAKVKAQLAALERAARPVALASDTAGTVVEVLVKPGDVVTPGQPIARVR